MGSPRFIAIGTLALGLGAPACVDPAPAVSADEQLAVACATVPAPIHGMDVSYYEDSIDWNAAHGAGIDFAFVRVSDGTTYRDPKFAAYWAGARAAGVLRGAYQFFRPAEDPIAQAELLLDLMGPLDPGDLPPVIDVEVSGGLTQPEVAASVQSWVTHVAQRTGRVPIVYAGLYSWPDLTNSADVTTSPLWVAQYTSAACPNIPGPWPRWTFWQYSSTGSMPGIPGAMLDVNVFDGTLDDLRHFAEPGVCGDGVCRPGAESSDTCPADCPPCGVIAASGGVVDEGDACFVGGGPAPYLRHVPGAGDAGDLIWTHTTAAAKEVSFGQWNLYFAEAGRYRVEVYTAGAYARSKRAAYVVSGSGASTTVRIDQTAVDGWQSLGAIDFAAGGGQSIHLGDNTGEPSADNVQLVFDAIQLTRVDEAAPGPPPGSGGTGDGGTGGGGTGGGETDPPPVYPAPGDGGDGGAAPGHDRAGCATSRASGGPIALAALLVMRCRRRRRAGSPRIPR